MKTHVRTITLFAIAALLVLTACSGGQAPQSPTGDHFGPRGFGRGNMTDEQRAQMMQQMHDNAVAACEGKTESDACVMQNPRGQMNGTCVTADDGSVMCRGQRQGNWTGQRNRPSQ